MQDIYVGDYGKGIPLVFVHGFLGSSKIWKPQIDYFKNYFRVITLDIPGFGKSNKVKSHNNIEAIARTLLNCLNKKKINRFHLLGHSMGGMIVQEMTKISSNKVLKLICYSTGSRGEMPGRFETIEQSIESLKKKGLSFTVNKIAKTWFINGENAKYFNTSVDCGIQSSIKSTKNALKALKK